MSSCSDSAVLYMILERLMQLCYERAFGYTLDGQLIGHLVMETLMVAEQIAQIPDFPDELRRQLLHILLAHHGKLEHGSPKLPMTPEALVVAYLDDLDSKVEAMQRLIAEPHNEGDWARDLTDVRKTNLPPPGKCSAPAHHDRSRSGTAAANGRS